MPDGRLKWMITSDRCMTFGTRPLVGETLYLPSADKAGYLTEMQTRYALEPYILEFARTHETRGLAVLEIGVGLGADHQHFAEANAELWGIDLTERAVEHTRNRLACFGLSSHLVVSDAETLCFANNSFDRIYSWGVLHHSPDTTKAIFEVHRALKPGGTASVMIYHKWSMVGLMLWIRYALLGFRPWLTLSQVYARYLESPGTKAYSISEARRMFSPFRRVEISTVLTESEAGQRHKGPLLDLARRIWPRGIIRRFFPRIWIVHADRGNEVICAIHFRDYQHGGPEAAHRNNCSRVRLPSPRGPLQYQLRQGIKLGH